MSSDSVIEEIGVEVKRTPDDISRGDLLWAAGYLEGEGSFVSRDKGYLYVRAVSTDVDVLRRLHLIFGGNIHSRGKMKEGWKPSWEWVVCKTEEAKRIMRLLLPYMGNRRSRQIVNALWNNELHFRNGRKVSWPDKDELEESIDELGTWTSVAERYDVSDNTVRKWAARYGINK